MSYPCTELPWPLSHHLLGACSSQGWLEFIKTTRQYDGTMHFLPPANDVAIFFITEDNLLRKVNIGEAVRFREAKVTH